MFAIGPGQEEVVVDVPAGALVLFVSSQQQGMVHLWVELDTSQPTFERMFFLHGTDDEIPENHDYVGSVVNRPAVANHHVGAAEGVPVVWHLYEERRGR